MDLTGEFDRARRLIFAADEQAAKDLLLSLMPRIEQADRDDLMMEVFAQLGEIYLVRTAYNGVEECVRRIDDCLAIYRSIRAGTNPEAAAQVTMTDREIDHMLCRYTRRAQFLRTGYAAAYHGDHEGAELALLVLCNDCNDGAGQDFPDLADEYQHLITYARIICATALCDDDLYVQSVPLWDKVIEAIERPGPGREADDFLFVQAATGYGRFCIETGRLSEAEPWLRRAGARAEARGWALAKARTQLERGAAASTRADWRETQTLVHEAYPAIVEGYRAHDVARSWLYLGLIAIAVGELGDADERLRHAEQHWRDVERPLHIHRILLQRSWVDILRNEFDSATEKVVEAWRILDSWPRHTWLQYARLDDHMGTILRARALADPNNAAARLEQAADLKIPAALAVDSVRYAIADANARMRWATSVSARMLAGAFAVVYEWGKTDLLSEMIEYHCARGAFRAEPKAAAIAEWMDAATAAVPVEAEEEYALVASGAISVGDTSGLTRLGPLPPLRMDPGVPPIIGRYRELARERYGRDITADEAAWSTWP
ncbi:hypothetical protein CQY20_27595 [Mycolicibacterium agri]|uniref:Uncharacterized protein n=1 Tax=Mycolicibacterium agri TaxID=36811 RepID=A0A2A7MRT9_MYCAG|nr:hypothetical protein [Mycolicibacterium agri]PEG34041.1 hypothetical protein CQY20_27595 [Mycolicibacterium agri]GFG48992.1 hypothetical protein MAGR_04330 [Mycolicibacterium agri]